jgi:cell fate regulator YaaT (PSP1 superfamily)
MQGALPVLQTLAPPGAEHLVEVAFKGNRRGFYSTSDDNLREGAYVVVDAERGHDLGRVRSCGGVAKSKCSAAGASATQRIVRVANVDEVRQLGVLRADEERVRRQTRELVEKHDLKMKVSDAEWQWDRNKLTIYFTADRRVDFRELVRDLARTFRTRIELKQIGVRDEAALLGGMGRCGRQLCCATWLREIRPVSLQLAKDQNLSLNPSQISGTCGRLMCCLTYEHDSYLQARKRFPREGKLLQTSRGAEKVIGTDIWRETVTLLDENRQRRLVTLAELKHEIAAAEPAKRERPQAATKPEPTAPPSPPRAEDHPAGDGAASRVSTAPETSQDPPAEQKPAGGARRKRRGQKRPMPAAAVATSDGQSGRSPTATPAGKAEGATPKNTPRSRRKRGRRSGRNG